MSARWRTIWVLSTLTLAEISCEPTLTAGQWNCSNVEELEQTSALAFPTPQEPVAVPWRSSFEEGFCDYRGSTGFCYANDNASYELVESPVHSGRYAAAYRVSGQENDGLQARCVRHGQLPQAAYYGAWFYIPEEVSAADTWNLFHFEGREFDDPDLEEQHGLWDVSVRVADDNTLRPYVYDFLRGDTISNLSAGEIPIRKWFHLEVFLERTAKATGRFDVYLDGTLALSLSDLVTDDSQLGQWYVGNFAAEIRPEPNTLIVDDLTINTVRQGAN